MTPSKGDLRAAGLLVCLAAAAGATVALTHLMTRDKADANARNREMLAITAILGDAAYDNDPLEDRIMTSAAEEEFPDVIYPARRNGALTGAVLGVTALRGYVGPIRLLVGVDPSGRITGTSLVSHQETPGLGDLIEPGKSDWLASFAGRSLTNPEEKRWFVTSDGGAIDAISGATVSSRAVLAGIRNALIYFRLQRDELLGAGTAESEKDT